MSKRQRVHILSTVNAANVSKTGSTYTIKDVCGAVDGIVMNSMLYTGQELSAGVASLEGKPAPAGHPKNESGQFISALNGAALATAWIGSYVRNARHEGGRTLVDVVVNEAQARAHPDGAKLVERLDAAIAGTNAAPIHVSTGLLTQAVNASGESRGKKYSRIATNIQYDHLAILLHERGAGTPEDGVGMFLNAEGAEEAVETVELNAEPEDRRGDEGLSARLGAWIRRLVSNEGSELSFDQISRGLQSLLSDGGWVMEVFLHQFIWADRDNKLWRQGYAVGADGSVASAGEPVAVERRVSYEPITNTNREEPDIVKDKIIAALNAAGINIEGLDDGQLLVAYNALTRQPVEAKLNAANAQIATFEANARAAEETEAKALAAELAVNSVLTVDDLQKLGAARLREIKGARQGAAPVLPGAASAPAANAANEFADYDLNAILKGGDKQ
jgi:hypothetical protein